MLISYQYKTSKALLNVKTNKYIREKRKLKKNKERKIMDKPTSVLNSNKENHVSLIWSFMDGWTIQIIENVTEQNLAMYTFKRHIVDYIAQLKF